MLGFVLFYGLEYMVASSPSGERVDSVVTFSLRIATFAGYSGLIAYLLVDNPWKDVASLLLYALAMAFHMLLVDHSLAEQGGEMYERRGRQSCGWPGSRDVCGGVIMNSLVVELPEGRGGRFWYFVMAATAYAFVLIRVLR